MSGLVLLNNAVIQGLLQSANIHFAINRCQGGGILESHWNQIDICAMWCEVEEERGPTWRWRVLSFVAKDDLPESSEDDL